MTETMGTAAGGNPPSTESSTREVAKEEARGVAQDAVRTTKQTAETAKEQASEVAGEAMSQARSLFEQARTQVTTTGTQQQQAAASGLRSLAEELSGMVEGATQQGPATDLAQQAAERVRTAADWLEQREPGELLDEVRRFARRRPGTFLLGAAAIGFLGGRLTRGLVEEARDSQGESGEASPSVRPMTSPTAGRAMNSPTNATGLPGAVQSEGGYASPSPAGGGFGAGATGGLTSGVAGAAPADPGYAVPPSVDDPDGDRTAQFTPTAPGAGFDEGANTTDQMPSEFGARGAGVSGNRDDEGLR